MATVCICYDKRTERFFEYSSLFNAPVSFALREPEFCDYIREEYGEKGRKALSHRLFQARHFGSDHPNRYSAEQVVRHNKMGKGGKPLSLDEIVNRLTQRPSHTRTGTYISANTNEPSASY